MDAERTCPQCGAELPRDAMEGLCPKCMARVVFGEGEAAGWKAEEKPAATTEMETSAELMVEQAGMMIGRYKLLQQIGEGGMGVVYMAEQVEPVRRRVALKVIKLGMDTKSVIARFEAERQALALMDHPNIAKVFDAGATDTGRPYFVMELVRGIKITDYCDQNHLTTQQRLDLFTQICKAIQHAHQKGIIHRDIKPSNILVTLHDGVPVPKIIDFGIAKATSDQRLTDKTLFTAFQQFIGTPAYMSPEQAEMSGLDIDTRSDIYSLGVLLYELLTGRTPFDAKELLQAGLDEMRRKIREDEPRKPSTRLSTMGMADAVDVTNRFNMSPTKLAALVRGDLDWIVMKAMEKDRVRRYETANGLAMDIQRHLSNEPVIACPPNNFYRFQKLARRHRVAATFTSALILSLTAGIVISALQARRANRERARAVAAAKEAKSVLDFFQEKVLSAGRPEGQEGGLGREATLRAAVDAAEPEIGKTFADRPLVEASIRHVLGMTYLYLGDTGKALRQLERALELRKKHLGSSHADIVESMNNLSQAYLQAGRPAEARQLLEQTLELVRSELGTNHTNTLSVMTHIAAANIREGRSAAAVPVFERVLELQRVQMGPDNPETLTTMNNLAVAYQETGRHTNAIQVLEEAIERRKVVLSRDHPYTLVSMNNLALSYQKMGRLTNALQLYEQVLKLQEGKISSDHPDALVSLNNFATALMDAGRPSEALPHLQAILKKYEDKFGRDNPNTIGALNNLAFAFQLAGQFTNALPLIEEALQGCKTSFGAADSRTLKAMGNLAVVHLKTGQSEKALSLFEQVEKASRAALGDDHPDTLRAINNHAVVFARLGRQTNAIPLSEEVLRLGRRKLGDDHPDVLVWIGNLARHYRDAGRTNEALPWFEEAYRRLKTNSGPDRPETLSALSDLADAYSRTARWPEAESRWRELLNLQREKLPEDDPVLSATTSRLAESLSRQGKHSEAESLRTKLK